MSLDKDEKDGTVDTLHHGGKLFSHSPQGNPQAYRLLTSIEGVAGGGGRESRSSLGKAPGPKMGPPSLLGGSPTRLLLS